MIKIFMRTSKSLELSKENIVEMFSSSIGWSWILRLQLDSDMVEWMTTGGTPSLVDTEHQGIERLLGRNLQGFSGSR